jgi:hypothetical protein
MFLSTDSLETEMAQKAQAFGSITTLCKILSRAVGGARYPDTVFRAGLSETETIAQCLGLRSR